LIEAETGIATAQKGASAACRARCRETRQLTYQANMSGTLIVIGDVLMQQGNLRIAIIWCVSAEGR
jgi:hypothetical protein